MRGLALVLLCSSFSWASLSIGEAEQAYAQLDEGLILPELESTRELRAAADSRDDLLRVAQDTSQPLNVRLAAIYGLRYHVASDPATHDPLQRLAQRDSTMEVRMISLRVLGWAVNTYDDVRDFLLERADDEYNLGPKFEAVRALGQFRSAGVEHDVYDFLLREVRNADLPIKVACVKSLYWAVVDDYRPAAAKVRDLTKDSNVPVRQAAVETLSKDAWKFAAWICPDNPQECAPRQVLPMPEELSQQLPPALRPPQTPGFVISR
ncbi:MAG: hypothetical protein HYT79_05465 [Elusimicrobia bacterium]|nr:hypothetical protein [Elusimicrobiota bacterium]